MADAVQNVDSVIGAIGSVAVDAAEIALIAQYPFLGLPVIKQIWEYIVSKLETEVIAQLDKGANIITIEIIDSNENKSAVAANNNLKAVQGDPNATDAQKQAALQAFQSAYGKLIYDDELPVNG